jgi:hypothetical protein
MKTFNYLFFVVSLLILSSCNKDLIDDKKTSDLKILHFDSYSQMQEELSVVLKMSTAEKSNWAKRKGFTSYGVEADLFYESVDPERFTSKGEMINFINNSKYLELITDINGDESIQTKSSNSRYRYFMNNDKIFSVEDKAIKVIDNDIILTCIDNLKELNQIESAEMVVNNSDYEVLNNKKSMLKSSYPGCGLGDSDLDKEVTVNKRTYRVKLEIWVEDNYRWGTNYAETFYKVTSQRTTLGVFWNYQNYITYNLMLRSHYVNGIGNWGYHYFNVSGTNVYASVIEDSKSNATANYNHNTAIHFDEYDCEAYVSQTVNNRANFACN